MITLQLIDDIVTWDGTKEFGRFVLSHCEDGGLPDYKRMDLMQIPQLIPHIWVYDLRSEDKIKDLRLGFVGEVHTQLHGKNICGKSDTKLIFDFTKTNEVVDHFHKSIDMKCAAYTRRNGEIFINGENKHVTNETLFFPCSSDGESVNWGIGCLSWKFGTLQNEKIFRYF